jgi:hypothetical protein
LNHRDTEAQRRGEMRREEGEIGRVRDFEPQRHREEIKYLRMEEIEKRIFY